MRNQAIGLRMQLLKQAKIVGAGESRQDTIRGAGRVIHCNPSIQTGYEAAIDEGRRRTAELVEPMFEVEALQRTRGAGGGIKRQYLCGHWLWLLSREIEDTVSETSSPLPFKRRAGVGMGFLIRNIPIPFLTSP